MAKFTNTLDIEFKYTLNLMRVVSLRKAAARVKSAHLCRYSRFSDNLIK